MRCLVVMNDARKLDGDARITLPTDLTCEGDTPISAAMTSTVCFRARRAADVTAVARTDLSLLTPSSSAQAANCEASMATDIEGIVTFPTTTPSIFPISSPVRSGARGHSFDECPYRCLGGEIRQSGLAVGFGTRLTAPKPSDVSNFYLLQNRPIGSRCTTYNRRAPELGI